MAEEISAHKAGGLGRLGLSVTTPWSVPTASVHMNSEICRNAFLKKEIGHGHPPKSARMRQKAPFFLPGKMFRVVRALRCHGLETTVLPRSVPLNSGIFHKSFLILNISDERPRELGHLVPKSATRSPQCNDPLSAGIRSETLELFTRMVADRPVRFERRGEWVPVPGSDYRVVNTYGSPGRLGGIHSPRQVDYGAGVKQLGSEISGGSIGKEGYS
jgi:hypothetical protein